MPHFVDFAVQNYNVTIDSVEMVESKGELLKSVDELVDMARAYAVGAWEVIKNEELRSVETPKYTYLSDGRGTKIELVGTMDRETAWVWDIKTGREWSAEDVARSRQFAIYAELFHGEYGTRPSGVKVQNVRKYRDRYVHGVVACEDRPATRQALWKTLKGATIARKKGVETPAPTGSWYCSAKWCPEYPTCEYVIRR